MAFFTYWFLYGPAEAEINKDVLAVISAKSDIFGLYIPKYDSLVMEILNSQKNLHENHPGLFLFHVSIVFQ